ncbi:ferric siderophore ABC transporter periplasmic siderophore-binding protein bauB [Pseudomonas saudimassiliensis]|uniref:Ferric siderophore ABC transporter periplasmic siderophore-binding protein bauB n=1 Tax=Pseudomonas saudimassiliensis TaxID=1461581 RepID=A0A078MDS2_9PSED|nr:siderophore ABC transporter substrate-binding protein [Pseudomonas saudimassiliensis]CEA03612.1 ferric siderophore ABC transporter periplasmic siderophore-binding protein bauB [Pseudomonas saudimassiliensis]CEF26249.1 ferric siderophore ABC transporter periplasmic siderophore-binding protein bauB [Pseudomonas saudimassiliensis]
MLSGLSRFAAVSSVCLALALGAGAAVAHSETVTVAHSSGQTQVPVQPHKVVVLDWSTLDTLAQLGVTVAGIPSSNPPEMLKQYREGDFVRAGTLFEPDFEALKSAEPDLIVLGRRAQGKYEEVSKFGTTIDLTPDPNDLLGSVERNTLLLGEIFGKQDKAAELVARLKASVSELRELTAGQGDGLLVLTTGGKMAAFGKGTRFGLIHDVFGVEQAVDELKTGRHGQSVSFEFLLEADPDWLFVMDRDAAIGREGTAAAELMDNELVAATSAGSKGQIVYLDPASWYLLDNSGIGVMQNSVDELIKVFSAAR